MSMVRCTADEHYYDSSKHQTCPYCRGNTQSVTPGGRKSDENTQSAGRGRAADENTRRAPGARDPDEATKRMSSPKWQGATGSGTGRREEPHTRLISGRKPDKPVESGGAGAGKAVPAPVVGWLVVAKGPGRGADLRIRPGQNRIGRGRGMDIVLDFGDASVSSEVHAFLIYDYQNNRFHLKHGEGKNLTYLNGQPVLDTQALKTGDMIGIGETELRFVPFCDERFNWDA
jgi:hypothetical protein